MAYSSIRTLATSLLIFAAPLSATALTSVALTGLGTTAALAWGDGNWGQAPRSSDWGGYGGQQKQKGPWGQGRPKKTTCGGEPCGYRPGKGQGPWGQSSNGRGQGGDGWGRGQGGGRNPWAMNGRNW